LQCVGGIRAWLRRGPHQLAQPDEIVGSPACQRGRMVIIEVLKPAKPSRPVCDTS
jgi:hypothetical protein